MLIVNGVSTIICQTHWPVIVVGFTRLKVVQRTLLYGNVTVTANC